MFTQKPRLLVKTTPLAAGFGFQLGKIPFKLEPLTPPSPQTAVLGAAAPAQWHLTDAPEGLDEVHVWDLCHRLHSQGMGAAATPVEAAEPDLQQQWVFDRPDRMAAKAFQVASSPDVCKQPDAPDPRYPSPKNFDWRWFQDLDHSGLDAARSQIQNPANRVSIAHLDTGYRKGHSVLPQFLDTAAQHNFIEGEDPNDASDPDHGGLGQNPGHGTGTISILAGALFNGGPFNDPSGLVGGAPFARVVPVRVANSVVLFTTSSVARGIDYATRNNLDVLSMSMGGVPSQAWADMVNAAYEAGLTLVTAAGNNFGPFKLRVPRFIVYPARFRRVIAACGVMSDGKPFADFLDPRKMAGSYGPDSKMDTAMAAYTPNTGWAKYACTNLINFDGTGTSAATPQVAAAAACWLQKNLDAVHNLPERWMRVEAVRQALFSSADPKDREHFGRGSLRAKLAMDQALANPNSLKKQAVDSVGVPILGPVLGELFGAAAMSPKQKMLHIEAAQVLTRSAELQKILAEANQDPDRPQHDVPRDVLNRFVQAMADDPDTSNTLKQALGVSAGKDTPVVSVGPVSAEVPAFPEPVTRKLRVFAFDPALGMRVDTESLTETTLEVPWERDLKPGPVGEYIEVVDVDPASDACYAPVDLNHPHILAANGLDPAEGVPQFHQQMVYATAMTTISRFEDALGRKALWAPQITKPKDGVHSQYVQRLRIYPHALREDNAYYSPPKKSLLFGYFQASLSNAGDNLPGGLVFSCLSHDIVAHETTHALLDGLHRYYQEQTNPDVAAFHEGFADIVAIFQHFTIPEALKNTLAKTRGDLRCDSLLADLAQQFGQARDGSRALRSALGKPPKPTDYPDYVMTNDAHALGAVLVSAVFHAFLEMYDARITDLKRLATGGTGVIPAGDIPIDLVNRMATEAAATASHVLSTCVRALDYCPPVDITFGEYLRALITADMDLEPEDKLNYRTAFITGFRARGIFPSGVRTLSEQNLRWQPPNLPMEGERITSLLESLDMTWNLSTDRKQAYLRSEANSEKLWKWLKQNLKLDEAKALEADLGIYLTPGDDLPKGIGKYSDGSPIFEIHSVRPARRVGSRGQALTDLVVEAVQRCEVDGETYRGGCALLIDLQRQRIRYAIRKKVGSQERIETQQNFRLAAAEGGQAYFDSHQSREPFAILHRGM